MTPATVFIHPDRKPPRIQPVRAIRAIRKLIADKEDTAQVFHIIDALNGANLSKDFERFLASEHGPAALRTKTQYPSVLDDHESLLQLPEGTLGRKYVDFMRREQLTAAGLVEESLKVESNGRAFDDDLSWYADRLRDTHDLYHVLTGYGRDALGELCLLRFTHQQTGGRGISFITWVGERRFHKGLPSLKREVTEALMEGDARGKAAERIIDLDLLSMLDQPINDVREKIGLTRPEKYKSTLRSIAELIERVESRGTGFTPHQAAQ